MPVTECLSFVVRWSAVLVLLPANLKTEVKYMYYNFSGRSAAAVFVMLLSGSVIITATAVRASDLSDATDMREKCEAQFRIIEVPVKNFGNNYVRGYYKTAVDLLRDAKIKIAQSKYQDAIAIYNKIFPLYKDMYK